MTEMMMEHGATVNIKGRNRWAVKISIVKLSGMLDDDRVNKRKMGIYAQIVILEKKKQ